MGFKINNGIQEANSYKYLGLWVEQPETDMTVSLGAGSMVSRPLDMIEFMYKLFEGKIVNANSLEQMKTVKDGLGMGLLPLPYENKMGYGMAGGIDGFKAIMVYFPEDKLSYALTCNGDNYDVNIISMAVMAAMLHKPFELPKFNEQDAGPSDLDQYLGVYKSEKMGFAVTISKLNNKLMAQASGQEAFPLDAAAKDSFKFELVGLEMIFDPAKNTLKLKQGGKEMNFQRTIPNTNTK
jgi:CubicO group peptidase (beta-lactamase class C family)